MIARAFGEHPTRVNSLRIKKRATLSSTFCISVKTRGLDRDLYSVPAAALKDMKCEMTIFDGRVVYQSQQGSRSAKPN